MKHSINFEDLFDWSIESDRYYYKMIAHQQEWEEFENHKFIKPTIVKHENNNESRKVRKYLKTGVRARLSLSLKALRTKSRIK